jgi:hypothetical protein
VLLFDPATGERRLRMIEEPAEYARVKRLHPRADEELLRRLRDDLEDRLAGAGELFANGDIPASGNSPTIWLKLLAKWDDTLANLLQLSPQKGLHASDLDAEIERLYTDHVAPQPRYSQEIAPRTRGDLRGRCDEIWRTAELWHRIASKVRLEPFTFSGDAAHMDYAYPRRDGIRGFVQTLSVSRSPGDVRALVFNVGHVRQKLAASEFAAVTDVPLIEENKSHKFVQHALQEAGVESVPIDRFRVWVEQKKPFIQ